MKLLHIPSIIIPKIESKLFLYTIIICLIIFVSYVKNDLDSKFKFLISTPSKILILILIILTAQENIQLSLILAIIYVILISTTLTNNIEESKKKIIN